MIFNSPSDFLSLHQNIQYYNTHRNSCYLDKNLIVLLKKSGSSKILDENLPEQIFKKTQEFYEGCISDGLWLKLIKKDIHNLKLENSNISSDVIEKIELLQKPLFKGPKPIDWMKLGILNVVTVFDQDAPDHNGAMRSSLYSALRSPDNLIIMPKTVFTKGPKDRWIKHIQGQNWVMLEQKGSGFLVCMPKNFLINPEDMKASIQHLDLNPDQLDQVTLDDIYTQNAKQKRPTVEQWEALWSGSLLLKKRWCFIGHGLSNGDKTSHRDEDTYIAALQKPNFHKLILALKKHANQFIVFDSCHIGRTLPESQRQFFSECHFPIYLNGRIDTPTSVFDLDYSFFWVGVHDFLKNPSRGSKTSKAFSKHLRDYRKEFPEFEPCKGFGLYINQPALLSPHSAGIPMGFKTLESPSTPQVHTISYGDVIAAKLESQKPFKKYQPTSEITVPAEKAIVELYPPIIDVPMRFQDPKVQVHSMIPGKAQHYMQKIILENGGSKQFFDAIFEGINKTKSPKGLFIETLESKNETLKNISILMTEEKKQISYFDLMVKEDKVITIDTRSNFTKNIPVTFMERWLAIANALRETLPFSSESVHLCTGGQAERFDVLQWVRDNFKAQGENARELEPLYSILSALMRDKKDFDFIKEMEHLPAHFHEGIVQWIIEATQDPKIFMKCLQKGFIDDKNWKVVKFLPEKDRGEIYEACLRLDIIKEKDLVDALSSNSNLDWVEILTSYLESHKDISLSILQAINKWLKFGLVINKPSEQFFVLLGRKEILPHLNVTEVCKGIARESLANIKTLVEKGLQYSERPQDVFANIIPVMLERGFFEGLEWILSYNEKHQLLEPKACLQKIREGLYLLQPGCYLYENNTFIVKLIQKVRQLIDLDENKLVSFYLSDSTFLAGCQLITEEVVIRHPEIRIIMLKKLKQMRYQSHPQFFEHVEKLFVFTKEEKKKLIKKLLPDAVRLSDKFLIFKLASWMNLLPENEKQEVLRKSFKKAFGNELSMSILITLGMDIECKEFVDVLKDELIRSDDKLTSYDFFVTHMKKAFNQLSDDFIKINIKNNVISNKPTQLMLDYMLNERKISKLSKAFIMQLNKLSYNQKFEVKDAFLEEIVEWCVQQGANLQDIHSTQIDVWFSNSMIPRLVASGGSLELIKMLLKLRSQSDSPEIYDKVLWVSAWKGRLDLVSYLQEQGCRYASDVIQRAWFYAAERGYSECQDAIMKKEFCYVSFNI